MHNDNYNDEHSIFLSNLLITFVVLVESVFTLFSIMSLI